MASKYLLEFQRLIGVENNLKSALSSAIQLYIQDKYAKDANVSTLQENQEPSNPNLLKALLAYLAHLETADVGSLILYYTFKQTLPAELMELVNIAKLMEERSLSTTSPLVSDCENKSAGDGHSPQIIFSQTARLESALLKKDVPQRHQLEVSTKRDEWLAMLFEKFAQLILNSTSLDHLTTLYKEAFSEKICEGLPKLTAFRAEIEAQIEYLGDNDFFEDYYECSTLAEKYDFVYEYYQFTKRNNTNTPELRATLTHLFYHIVNQAYAPCEAQRFNLMRDSGATLEDVFSQLKKWATQNSEWEKYAGTDLQTELQSRLANDEEEYQCWQEVSERMDNPRGAGPKPMYQLHCMKYAGNPSQDPRDLLKLLPSPVKRKSPSVQGPSSSRPEEAMPLTSLYSDEELDTDAEGKDLPTLITTTSADSTDADKKRSLPNMECSETLDNESLEDVHIDNKKRTKFM